MLKWGEPYRELVRYYIAHAKSPDCIVYEASLLCLRACFVYLAEENGFMIRVAIRNIESFS